MERKVLMKGIPENLPDLEDTFPIYLFNNETKIPRGPTIDVSKVAPGFMLQTNFEF